MTAPGEGPPDDGHRLPSDREEPTFAAVTALFRPRDVKAMARFFDLGSLVDVRAHADAIWERVEAGNMPCDRMWDEHELELFRRWMDADMPA